MNEHVVFSGSFQDEGDFLLLESKSGAQVRVRKSDVDLSDNTINIKIGTESEIVTKPPVKEDYHKVTGEFAHFDSNCKGSGMTYCIAGTRFCCDGGKVVGGCKLFDYWACGT